MNRRITGSGILMVALAWLGAGGFWAMGQFALSEAFFQAGRHTGEDAMFALSDAVAWPAGHVYKIPERHYLRVALQQAAVRGGDLGARAEGCLESFDQHYGTGSEWQEVVDDVLQTAGIDPTVPMLVEYAVYVGICLVWGSLVSAVGFAATMLYMNLRPITV